MSKAEFWNRLDDDILDDLAHDYREQQQLDAVIDALAHPRDGKDSKLSPEAYSILIAAKR